KHLDITTAAADIGGADADQGLPVTETEGKGNFVTGPSPAASRHRGCTLISLRKESDPWAFSFAQKLHPHMNLLNRLRISRPHYLASRFLLTGLHADRVPDLEVMLNVAQPRA